MKILSETVHTGSYLFLSFIATIFALAFLVLAVAFVWEMIKKKSTNSWDVFGLLFMSALTVLFSFGAHSIITDGANITYKATITDFNVVYEQGYKITGQEGEIYLLEKSK